MKDFNAGKKEDEKIAGENAEAVAQPEECREQLARAREEAAENLAGWQRAKADFLNFKKDQEKVLGELQKYANQELILELLPTVDNFELAAKHLPEELSGAEWVKGVMCIKGMFENFLREAGVNEIKAVGEKFDPNFCEAVGTVEKEGEEDLVVEEVQKGYRMDQRVIRPAKVKVSKRKEA